MPVTLYALYNTEPKADLGSPLPIIQRRVGESLFSGKLAVYKDRETAESELATYAEEGKDHIAIAEIEVSEDDVLDYD